MQRGSASPEQAAHPVAAPSALLASALEVGALTGSGGLLLGGAQGIVSSGTPALFAVFAGVQWFTAGSVYWATRSAILNRRGLQAWLDVKRGSRPNVSNGDSFSREEKVKASTIASGFSAGIVAAVTRGRSHIIPGAVMFSIFGFTGQHLYDFLDSRHAAHVEEAASTKTADSKSWLRRLADSRFSPVKVLSEDEYEHMLKEKLLKVDVEIALVDESIEKLRQQDQTPNDSQE